MCPKCQQRTRIIKYPQIVFFKNGATLKRKVEGQWFYLNSVLS